jgi:hypothetical protein
MLYNEIMSRSFIEKRFLETGIYHQYGITTLLAFLFQMTGLWVLMILAGAIGSVFAKILRHAFIGGFLGVGTAWSIYFFVLVAVAQAYTVAEFFATLIGLPEFGRFIVSLSILFGTLLGASGAVVGRAFLDLVGEIRASTRTELN